MLIVWVYSRWGKQVSGGNNLILERIHNSRAEFIPLRIVPLVLISTIVTHLFGGSAGREGTAVQMGAALGDSVSRLLRLGRRERRWLLQAGISGGFGAVFGTPLAGAIFGLEVVAMGGMNYAALIPCLTSAIIGDLVVRGFSISHGHYVAIGLTRIPWFAVIGAGCLFGIAAYLFIEGTERVAQILRKWVSYPLLHPVIGGSIVIAFTYLLGTRDYLGLSLPLLAQSFTPTSVPLWAGLMKIVFTAVTLGSGFKGGEVTPLFVIGATLGAAYGQSIHQSVSYFAALGFVAVFAAAANTPFACTLLAVELFGAKFALPALVCNLLAYTLTGHRGIYRSQALGTAKARGLLRRDFCCGASVTKL